MAAALRKHRATRHHVAALLLVALIVATVVEIASPRAQMLTGFMLVATERMGDPRFQETVIYLVEHDESGAFGLIVNRPFADGPLAVLLEEFGLDAKDASGTITLHYGGPVDQSLGFVLHSPDYAIEGTRVIDPSIAFTNRPQVLEDIARGAGPAQVLLAFGYAGWGPGQLEGEIARGDWITVDGDAALVFDSDAESKWRRAIDREAGDYI